MNAELHVYHIGEYGEVFAARSEQEAKDYYRDLSSYTQEEADKRFANEFAEITDLDTPFKLKDSDDGTEEMTTWRQLAEDSDLPTQLSTMYT